MLLNRSMQWDDSPQHVMWALSQWARSFAPAEEFEDTMVLLLVIILFLGITTLGKLAMIMARGGPKARVD